MVKVQSGREESIKDAIERRVKIEGLEEFFGQILIPTEKVVEMRSENLQRSAEPAPSSARATEPCRWFRSHTRAYRMFN